MKIYILAIIMLTTSLHVVAGEQDREAITGILMQQQDAWNKGDMEGYMDGYWRNDSLVFVGKSGITYGWEPTLNNYKKSYSSPAQMGQLAFTLVKVEVLTGSEAFVLGKWSLKREAGDLAGYFSLRLRKFGEEWKVVLDHSS